MNWPWSWWSAWWQRFVEKLRPADTQPPSPYEPYPANWGWADQHNVEKYDRLYQSQPHVRTVVDFIAVNLGQIGIHVYRRRANDDRVRVNDHPLAKLLRQPNPSTTRDRFIVDLITDYLIDGHAYAAKIRPPGGGLELYRMEPGNVVASGDVVPRQFVWTPIAGAPPIVLPASEVLYLRQPRGLSPLESLRALLEEDQAGVAYRSRFFKNFARLGGVIYRPMGAPKWQPDQRRMFRKQWRQYQGPAGSGKTVVLEDGMTYEQITATAEQSQMVQGRKLTREEVAAAYHVPPAMIGIVESQGYGSIREQHKSLYQDTLGPHIAMLEGDFALQLLSEFSDNEDVYVEFNIDEKLQGSFEEAAGALVTSTGSPYVSVNEARARLNLPKIADPAYDKPVLRLDTAPGQDQKRRQALPAASNGVVE
jgi:HK97 family phage portal protein